MPIEKVTTLDHLPEDLIESKHAARLAQCHIQAVYRWILKGKLRGWRRCGRTFVSRAELMGLFEPMPTQKEKPVNDIPSRRDLKRNDKWVESELKRFGLGEYAQQGK